jgi:arsenite-transporting ATPase
MNYNMSLEKILSQGAKFIFVGGKGGVGKTVVAAAIALYSANIGSRTLLASLNPVHSLTNLFREDLSSGNIKKIGSEGELFAVEVDITDAVERYRENVSIRLREFLKWAEIPLDPTPFIDIATTNPAFQESAMFDKVMDIILKEGKNFDRIVFDTAAVANAIRLLSLSNIYGLWLKKMIESRKEALGLRAQLSFRKDEVLAEIQKDPVMLDLLNLNGKFTQVKSILTNPSYTKFFFVTLLQALPISVVVRFMNSVKSYNIPVGGVIVNQVISEIDAEKDESNYLKSKYEEQLNYLELLKKSVGIENIVGYIRQFPRDVVGLENLRLVVKDLIEFKFK